jgi:hypothetical protein
MTTLTIPSAQIAADPLVLDAIRREDCNLAIWERPDIADFAPLLGGTPQHLRFNSTLEELGTQLSTGLRQHRFAAKHLHDALVADVAMLAERFCTALGMARFEVRLEVVTTDSCRKFHADYVRARLITTYVGPGTDWLDGKDAAAVARGDEPARINRMEPGDVGLFKGKLATMHPAIHRSPPISTTGEQRLLLVLNPVEAERANRAM